MPPRLPALPLLLPWVGLVGCAARDAGGQEGEEWDGGAESTDDNGGGGDDGGDAGGSDSDELDGEGRWTGSLRHERGTGARPGARDCVLLWDTAGAQVSTEGCPDCAFVFAVEETLDRTASTGLAACADDAVDTTRRLGFVEDYAGYGSALFSVDGAYGETDLLGFAQLDDGELHWSYGFEDYAFSDDGARLYSTWWWEGRATLD